ncbi:MAG TPA: response regulator [Ktedonobacteraceae bacterium]|jgi:YesN/AraC family two-component response regulator
MNNRPLYRIVVAEDEEIARRALRLLCERSRCPVEVACEARTGRQVLEALEQVRPHIILMDVVMPGMDGLETTRLVRARFPETKVAIVSAYDTFDYAQQALRAGAVDYLLKPVRPAQLEAFLARLCNELDTARAPRLNAPLPPEGGADALPHAYVLRRVREFIATHYAHSLSLEQLAGQVALSPPYLSRIFRQEMGCTYIEYLTRVRMEAARRLLRTTTLSLAQISVAIGYQNPNYLSTLFKAHEGLTASAYRRAAAYED